MRTTITRSLQALVSIAAVALLTGANDPGCSPSGDGGGEGGFAGGGTAGGSTGTGVVCPDGFEGQWVCADAPSDPTHDCNTDPPPCDPMVDATCPPAPGCWLECVQTNLCGPGWHEEYVCVDEPPPVDADGGVPVPPGPNTGVGTPGAAGAGGATGGGGCTLTCVPDNACPPDMVQVTVCATPATDPADPNSPPPMPGDEVCWNECQPVDPVCPPGTHADQVCPPDNMGAPCELICTPDDPGTPVPPQQ